jgi:beta-glucosidase-like glycosyl hydrolase
MCLSWANCKQWFCDITNQAIFMYQCGAPLSDNPEPLLSPTIDTWQQWKYNTDTLSLTNNGSCLTAPDNTRQNGELVSMQPCDDTNKYQQWIYNLIDHTIQPVINQSQCLDFGTYLTCDQSPISSNPHCNSSLTPYERAKDLLNRMTTTEKISQMMHNARAIPRLGVPYYSYWNSADHGVSSPWNPATTQFPQVIGIAASFNESSFLAIAQAISDEGRAKNNLDLYGITFWSPNINIFRDPRWGRGQETPGEDPYLSSRYVTLFVHGLQEGNDKSCLKSSATCKHYAAYSLDKWRNYERHSFNAIVDKQDLEETYLPAFEACVKQGKAKAIMCSYNALNGVPTCASSLLLEDIARQRWNFDGLVVSDCDSVLDILESHHYTNTTWDAVTAAIKAGTDMDCGYYYKYVPEALNRGLLTVKDLDQAVLRIMKQRYELGMFDSQCSYQNIGPEVINSVEHQNLALQSASEGIVLLKNEGNVLPLSSNKELTIAVIGPNANNSATLLGNYYGMAPFVVTPLQGIIQSKAAKQVLYAKGCEISGTDKTGFVQAIDIAKKSDVAILFVGTDQTVAAEGLDLESLELPGVQQDFILEIQETGVLTIVVFVSGGPLAIPNAQESVPAIIQSWYGGQSAGTAIADVIFGKYNPGGVLPVTFYPSKYVDLIDMNDMNMRRYPGRTYRYLQIDPIYPFGYGLSYTKFSVSVSVPQQYYSIQQLGDSIPVSVTVKNTGKLFGDYVVLSFVKYDKQLGSESIKKQLFAFKRVQLAPNQQQSFLFSFNQQYLYRYDASGSNRNIYPGEYCIIIGIDHAVTCFTLEQ